MADFYVQDEPAKAIELYIELADKLTDKKADLLLLAARLQIESDPKRALNLLESIDSDEARYLQGRCYFSQNDYEKTIETLRPLAQTDHVHDKSILYMLTISANNLNLPHLVIEWGNQFAQSYPDDRTLSHLYYTLAMAHKQIGNRSAAISSLDKALAAELSFEGCFSHRLHVYKALYELEDYSKVQGYLDAALNSYQDHPDAHLLHLLYAMCAHQQDPMSQTFIDHAEKTLALDPKQTEANKLRLNLFVAYKKNGDRLGEAANHLYQAIQNDSTSVKQENQLWLANFLYDQVKTPYAELVTEPLSNQLQISVAEKSADVFSAALDIEHTTDLPIEKAVSLEAEFFKLANLYGWLDMLQEQEKLLKQLTEWQENYPSLQWSLRTRTQFSLARLLYEEQLVNQAQRLFQVLLSQKGTDPFITKAAKLFNARLAFELMPDEEKNIRNSKIVNILQNLKDLQIRKTLAHEPLHLEAALDYAAIRASLEPKGAQSKQQYTLLLKAKESFTCQDDLCSKEYQASRLRYPDKERIYQAYLMLFDAHILKHEAEMAALNGHQDEAALKKSAAIEMYNTILKEKFSVSKYLHDQAVLNLNELATHVSSPSE
jgi:tetratricopeptide (TPR) repeat protein